MSMKRSLTFTLMVLVLSGSVAMAGGRPGETYQADRESVSNRAVGRGSYLDIGVVDVTRERAASLRLKHERGALVTHVGSDGPAAKAGLQKDDVIVKWNGEPIEGAVELWRRKRETPGGRTVRLGVIRDGREIELDVTLGESSRGPREPRFRSREVRRPARAIAAVPGITVAPMAARPLRVARAPRVARALRSAVRGGNRLGLRVETLTPQLAEHFGLTNQTGALISWVQADSPAAKAGLKAGDVIVSVAGESIRTGFDIMRATRGKAGESVEVKIIRDKQERTLTVQLEKGDNPAWRDDDEDLDDDFDEIIIELPVVRLQEIDLPKLVLPDIKPIVIAAPKIDLSNLAPVVVPFPQIKIAPIQIAPIKIAPIKIAPMRLHL